MLRAVIHGDLFVPNAAKIVYDKFMTFSEIIGQDELIAHMQNALRSRKTSHAYMIEGERHAGKMMLAEAFAASLLCEKKGIEPCGQCLSCRQANGRNNPDIRYVTHEKPNLISVEEIRQQVNRDVVMRPYAGTHKIYIIDEAEKMNESAQNALLKTIEEPPDYVVIMLLSANSERFLDTVRSRCVILPIRPVPDEAIKRHLILKLGLPDYQADICAAFAQGNVGKAELIAADEEFNELRADVVGFLNRVKTVPSYEMMEEVEEIEKKYKDRAEEYLDLLVIWFRDVLLYKSVGAEAKLIYRDDIYLAQIKRFANAASFEGLNDIFTALDGARARLRANVSFRLVMELLFLTMKEV